VSTSTGWPRGKSVRNQRGRGRSGGRAVSERGRIRRRPSGGGTLRKKSPQQGQCPSLATGPVTSTRSQWPRNSHIGLMHCTVKPGRYCIVSPQRPHSLANPATDALKQPHGGIGGAPGGPTARRGPPKENAWPEDPQLRPRTGDRAGTANLMARILPRALFGVKRKTPQGIVVRLQLCKT
jgi:hypothetical protein